MNSKLGPDLHHLLTHFGSPVKLLDEVTSLRSQRQRKASFKITLANGQTIKARRFVSVEKRVRYCDLSSLLADLPFARILAAEGKATLEEWVDGVPLEAAHVTAEQAYRLGNLMGKIHSLSAIPEPYRSDVPGPDHYLAKISERLSTLSVHFPGKISTFSALEHLAARHKPENFQTGLIHADFCPQNIVMTPDGAIVLVDNEHLRMGALDYDLARCWVRWDITRQQQRPFCEGYRRHRGTERFTRDQLFWAISALTLSAKVHLKHGRANKAVARALERLATDPAGGIWSLQ